MISMRIRLYMYLTQGKYTLDLASVTDICNWHIIQRSENKVLASMLDVRIWY